ncbi:MAG: hypothetical protein ACRDTG_29165 [Pseudonocardiaceae bacterium]
MPIGVADTTIRFRIDDRRLTLDYRKVPFSAWGELKAAVGFTQSTLVKALGDSDLDAVVALVWLERKQRERKLRFVELYHDLQHTEEHQDIEITEIVIAGRSYGDTETDADEEESDPTGGG